jgi:hypothetical protein
MAEQSLDSVRYWDHERDRETHQRAVSKRFGDQHQITLRLSAAGVAARSVGALDQRKVPLPMTARLSCIGAPNDPFDTFEPDAFEDAAVAHVDDLA